MILIAYDGSDGAQAAIRRAGELFAGQPAIVLTVWEGFSEVFARTRIGLVRAALDFEQVEQACERDARDRAETGAGLARQAGLAAEPMAAQQDTNVWETILDQASELGADAIVLGSRGLTGVRSMWLGSISQAVLKHSDRPVIVVPSPGVVASRTKHRSRAARREPMRAA